MNVECLTCEKSFYARPFDIKKGNGKFCSRKCWAKSRKGIPSPKKGTGLGKIKLECLACSKIFEVWPSRLKRGDTQFCSLKCARSVRSGTKAPCWKGGIKFEKHAGYVLLFKPDHPHSDSTGYIKRARFLTSETLGRPLKEKEVTHHINGIKDDDRIENLYLFPSQSEHQRYHRLSKSKKNILKSNLV
jgi:hypothetical protein